MTARARQVLTASAETFGVTQAQILDHSQRGEDVMDARAMAVWTLTRRLGYSRQRAAGTVGYKSGAQSLCQAYNRLALRVYQRPLIQSRIALLFPEPAVAA